MSECDFKVYTNCGCSFPTVENCEWCRDANHIAAVEKLERQCSFRFDQIANMATCVESHERKIEKLKALLREWRYSSL